MNVLNLIIRCLSFQVNTEYDHPRLYLVKYIGEAEVLIPRMDIADAVADLYFRRENKTGKKEIETYPKLRAEIIFLDLHQFFGPLGPFITGHINIVFKTRHGVHSEVADPVTLKFYLKGK